MELIPKSLPSTNLLFSLMHHIDEAMEPIWQQNDDPDTFDSPQPCPDAARINCDSEMLQSIHNHQNHCLDNHISHQLADNGLVDSSTMLNIEDR